MELKSMIRMEPLMIIQVLIVPLWNWNRVRPALPVALEGFNRTFMELKYKSLFTCGEGIGF